ncbi:MAG: hypothetical protein DHS20C10_02010 [marine bacterium B5-7]|nr:MAG: hypothetical protein DHS20C10_02010 [marine bacterium B5-7]
MTIEAMKALNKMTGGRLTLGKAVRALRLSDELSQGVLAKRLKVTQSYLSDLENGRKIISAKKAAAFAKRLGQSERQFVRLALQDGLVQQGLSQYEVELLKAA